MEDAVSSINDKDREIKLREEYYDALLYGGDISIFEMEPDVMYRCMVDISGYTGGVNSWLLEGYW